MLLICMHVCTHIQVEFTLLDSNMCKPPLKWAQGLINKTFSVQRSLLISLSLSHSLSHSLFLSTLTLSLSFLISHSPLSLFSPSPPVLFPVFCFIRRCQFNGFFVFFSSEVCICLDVFHVLLMHKCIVVIMVTLLAV